MVTYDFHYQRANWLTEYALQVAAKASHTPTGTEDLWRAMGSAMEAMGMVPKGCKEYIEAQIVYSLIKDERNSRIPRA